MTVGNQLYSSLSLLACVQTSPISFVARGKGPFSACNKGNRRRLHAGKSLLARQSMLMLTELPEIITVFSA